MQQFKNDFSVTYQSTNNKHSVKNYDDWCFKAFQICPCWDLNSGGSDLWSNVQPTRPRATNQTTEVPKTTN